MNSPVRPKPDLFLDMCRGKVPLAVVRSVSGMDVILFEKVRKFVRDYTKQHNLKDLEENSLAWNAFVTAAVSAVPAMASYQDAWPAFVCYKKTLAQRRSSVSSPSGTPTPETDPNISINDSYVLRQSCGGPQRQALSPSFPVRTGPYTLRPLSPDLVSSKAPLPAAHRRRLDVLQFRVERLAGKLRKLQGYADEIIADISGFDSDGDQLTYRAHHSPDLYK